MTPFIPKNWLFSVVMLGLAVAGAQADITTGLVGYWNCDDNVIDQSTNNNNGTIVGSVSYDADTPLVSGKSLNIPWPGGYTYSNQAQNYVSLGTATEHNFSTGDWTIAAWVKSTISTKGNIISNGGDEDDGIRYVLAIGETPALGTGKLVLTTDDNTTKVQVVSSGIVNNDQWHHVVGMRDGSTLRLYIDGQEDSYEFYVESLPSGPNPVPGGYDLSGTSQHDSYVGCGLTAKSTRRVCTAGPCRRRILPNYICITKLILETRV